MEIDMNICTELKAFTVVLIIVQNGPPDPLKSQTRFCQDFLNFRNLPLGKTLSFTFTLPLPLIFIINSIGRSSNGINRLIKSPNRLINNIFRLINGWGRPG